MPSACGSSRSWARSRRGSTERADELPVEVVAEQLERLGRLQPAQLVDLVVRGELAALGLHPVVAHELGAVLAVVVARVAERVRDAAGQAGLLLDLAQRGLLEALALVELPLRQAPVVVARPVHDGDA